MPVRYTSKDGLSSGLVRDISLGGVFILSRDVFPLGERLAMFFSHANFDKPVWINGDVIRVTSEGFGVRFGSMNENQKRAFLCIAYTQ
jgi:Tfp pilus assembly protein PilZ